MMRKAILAMEDDAVDVVQAETTELPVLVAQSEASLATAELEDQQLSEAEGLQNALEELIENIDNRGEDAALTPSEAELTNIAVEHICTRLGMASSLAPSLESFSEVTTAKKTTKELLKQLKVVQQRVATKLDLAYESIMSGARSGGKTNGLELDLKQAVSAFSSKKHPVSKKISGKKIAKLGSFTANEATTEGVIERISEIRKEILNGDISRDIEKIKGSLYRTLSMDANDFHNKPFDITLLDAFQDLATNVEKVKQKFNFNNGGGVEVMSLTTDDLSKFSNETSSMIRDFVKLDSNLIKIDEFQDTLNAKYAMSVEKGYLGRLVGFLLMSLVGFLIGWWWDGYSRDKKTKEKDQAYRRTAELFRNGVKALTEVETFMLGAVSGAIAYIEASE